jgi:RHS repeat-associated protein
LATDYTYDDNGNLTSDANKNIINITYNHLNLPNVITFADSNTITWLYDAAGVKLQKQTFESVLSTTNTHDYIGGIEYQDNVLEAIYTSEGRAMPNGANTYRYEYTIKDHLGNSRVMFCDVDNDGIVTESEIIQEDHYYPFGMRHEGYGRTITNAENFYQYNGKELNEDFGLDMYDYPEISGQVGARFYDASVGRWFAIDPLAEDFYEWSGYNYVLGNPVMLVDPDGKSPNKPLDDYYRNAAGDIIMTVRTTQNVDNFYTVSNTGVTLDETRSRTQEGWNRLTDGQKNYVVNKVEREVSPNNNSRAEGITEGIPTATPTSGIIGFYGSPNGALTISNNLTTHPINPGRTMGAASTLAPRVTTGIPTPAAGLTLPMPNGIIQPNQTVNITDALGNNLLNNPELRGKSDYVRFWD